MAQPPLSTPDAPQKMLDTLVSISYMCYMYANDKLIDCLASFASPPSSAQTSLTLVQSAFIGPLATSPLESTHTFPRLLLCNLLDLKPCRINSYTERACNPFIVNTYKNIGGEGGAVSDSSPFSAHGLIRFQPLLGADGDGRRKP